MRERKNKLKKPYTITITLFVVLVWNSSIFPQDFSNGSIDFIFEPENNWTQLAIWIEDENEKYIGTVYLTDFIGRRGGGNRTSDTNIDTQSGNRLSALPIWAHKRGVMDSTFGIENYYPPAESKSAYPDDIDAVSGATPNQNTQTKTWQLSGLPFGEYNCWIEVNRSYDFNQYHTYSFYRGQPSLVWNTTVNVTNSANSNMISDYLGYGSLDGSDGEINFPDSTITTAVNLLRDLGGYKFKVVYTPGSVIIVNNLLLDNFFDLEQNYPNPFNSSTEIRYFLPKSNHVNLTVYTIAGQKVAVLIDKLQTAGIKEVSWDGRNIEDQEVASGLYLFKIQTGEYTKTKTMVFLK